MEKTQGLLKFGGESYLCKHMRRFIAYILLVFLCIQTFFNLGISVYWLLNREYIASRYCINKKRPELHCDGKCYLRKKIAQQQDTMPSPVSSRFPELKKGVDLAEILPLGSLVLSYKVPAGEEIIPTVPGMVSEAEKGAFFHPPELA